MGLALRELANEDHRGEGPLQVLTHKQDFNTVTMQEPGSARTMTVPAQSLVAFTARSFRELRGDDGDGWSDVWEFVVDMPSAPGAPSVLGRTYLRAADIFMVQAPSKLTLA